ncbi:MAG: hypothetical protein QG577_2867 [Thermodesulfobacteriota bacterium]|nr:hypothetical protein [Thermodesulfobacteriota bacterium]
MQVLRRRYLDFRAFLESNRELGSTRPFLVIPAKAGIQGKTWIPDPVGDDNPRVNLDYSCYTGLVKMFFAGYKMATSTLVPFRQNFRE